MSIHSSMRREIERAIDEAVNPKGVSTHSGMARINAATLQRLLAIADAAETLPRAALAEPDAIARAVEAEREACAKICDGEATLYYSAQRCATKIRARGSK